jgi:LPXTG-site transpeptidase (sortase) family protein
MRTTGFSTTAFIIATSAGCAFLFVFIQFALRSEVNAAVQPPAQGIAFRQLPPASAGLPVRLRIPSINVDAAIESVGLTSKKAMDVPKNPQNVGWYNLGPRPGEKGNAVLAGHLDWYNGTTAVFQHLGRLSKGDVLSIETDKGRFLPFVVREIRTYDPFDYVPDVFQSSDKSHLNLVTCGGVWDTARKIYRKRLVVFTDAVTALP